jgi:hypothetical protein
LSNIWLFIPILDKKWTRATDTSSEGLHMFPTVFNSELTHNWWNTLFWVKNSQYKSLSEN